MIRTCGVKGLLFTAAVGLAVASLRGQTTVTRDQIAEAWKARELRVRSATFTWTEQKTVPKGRVTDFLLGAGGELAMQDMGIAPGEVVPPRDTTFEVRLGLSLDGNKMRYTRDDQCWSGEKKAYVPDPYVSTFDGRQAKVFSPLGVPYAKYPFGSIQTDDHHVDVRNVRLAPILNTVRPVDAAFRNFRVRAMSLPGRRATIQGRSCLELEHRQHSYLQRIWVDPSRDYVVVRELSTQDERPLIKWDVQFQQVDGLWVPKSWSIQKLHLNGKFDYSIQAVVTTVQINPTIAAPEFDILFPSGTLVTDMDTKVPLGNSTSYSQVALW